VKAGTSYCLLTLVQSRRFASPRSTLQLSDVFSTTLHISYVFYTMFVTPVGRVGNQRLLRIHGKLTMLQLSVCFMQLSSQTGTREEGSGMPGIKHLILNIRMHSLEPGNSLDTHKGIFLT
jgi:hypothetical protein